MINDRLDRIGDYPFDRLRALLDHLPQQTRDETISFALGEPQHPSPALVQQAINDNAHLWGRYPPVWGTPAFRNTAAGWLKRRYHLPDGMIDPETCIIPVSGTREALFMIALTVTPEAKRGKRPAVLMPNPFYQVYLGAASLAGADPIYVPATAETNFLPRFETVDEETLDRTALAYYCTPANPQGTVATIEQMKGLIELARAHDFVILFDECYSEIYTGDTPPPGGLEAAAALGGSLKNVLVFQSLSKRSSVPGLRSGFVAGDPEIMAAFKRVRDYGGAPPPLPLLAAATALWGDETHVEKNRDLYRQKFDMAEATLGNRFGYFRPDGGFYLWLDVGDGEAAAQKLWQEAALRVMPGVYLAHRAEGGVNPGAGYIRCALVHDIDTTRHALDRLSRCL
jgi:N-succinyldiaminopimelate aminotransferase